VIVRHNESHKQAFTFMWYKVGTTFFHFVTNHAFDRQADRRTNIGLQLYHGYIDRMQCTKRG